LDDESQNKLDVIGDKWALGEYPNAIKMGSDPNSFIELRETDAVDLHT